MNTIRAIQKLNQRELEEGINPEGSWHTDYRDTAFIYVGGLPFELSEGDIITIVSQFGEPVWIKLARDKETGKSRGFCWIKYEDQRSTDLAVDNLGGATVMGRVLRVDHARYKPRDDEDMMDNTMGELDPEEDEARRKRRKTDSDSESEEDRPLLKEEIELEKLVRDLDDDDPMKASMVRKKREEVEKALKTYERAKRKERKEKHRSRRHHRDRSDSRERDRHRKRIKDAEDDKHYSKSARPRNRSTDALGERNRDRRAQREDSRERDARRHRNQDRDKDRHDRDRERRRRNSDDEDIDARRKNSSRRDQTPDERYHSQRDRE